MKKLYCITLLTSLDHPNSLRLDSIERVCDPILEYTSFGPENKYRIELNLDI